LTNSPGTPAVFAEVDDLLSSAPRHLGTTAWVEVAPSDVQRFERATGGEISPYFAVSLTNRFLPQLIQVPGASSGLNYGADSARFGSPLQAGDRVRCSASLVSAQPVNGGVQTTVEVRVEVDGATEPACVVRSLSRWLR
jgi:acyl dehydratase